MLFGIYSVVTLASLVLSSGFAKYVKEKLKEEGYVYPWDDKNTKEKIFDFLPFAIIQIFVHKNVRRIHFFAFLFAYLQFLL